MVSLGPLRPIATLQATQCKPGLFLYRSGHSDRSFHRGNTQEAADHVAELKHKDARTDLNY